MMRCCKMVKVISFCLWGDDPKYTRGAIANAKLALEIYPGWECWFYCRKSVPIDVQSILAVMESCRVIYVDKPGSWTGMFDRFLPGIDSGVECFISRDCDSRLTTREAEAVNQWLVSSKGFHAMRDHPQHSVPILGGMWGMKRGAMSPMVLEHSMEQWQKEDRWQTDQEWLAAEVWAQYRDDFMCHDGGGFWLHIYHGFGFPTAREASGEFVGATYDADGVIDAAQVAELKRVTG